MIETRESTPIRRLGKWNSLFILSLVSGALFQLAPAAGAQTAPKPEPDVVVFTNGDQLSGTLERADGDSFLFKSDIVGEVTIPAAKIKELRTSGKFVALRNNEKITRKSKQPGPLTYAESVITVSDTQSGAPESVPVKDLGHLIDDSSFHKEVVANPGPFQGWSGSVTGGITLIESTDTGQTYTLAANLIRLIPSVAFLPPRTRSTLNVLETYGKITQPVVPQTVPPSPDTVAKTSIFHADAEHDKYLTPKIYALVGLSFDHNFAQGLNLQQIYGGGLGWTIIQTPVQEFDVKGDVHYERQNFQPPTQSLDLIGSSFTELYRRNLPRKVLFKESGTFIPAWNETDAYSAIFAASLDFPTYKRFSMTMNLIDNYLNKPAFGYKSNSLQFVLGVTYALK